VIKPAEVFKLAPIAVVMPFSVRYEALAKWHLNGKRV